MSAWTVKDSKKLYRIEQWGDGYFDINSKGNLCVYPQNEHSKSSPIDMVDVINTIRAQKIELPVIVRFDGILRNQVIRLNKVFQDVIQETGYKGAYRGVFPIKVNQMHEVVEQIIQAGRPYSFGLEAGSKQELMAVLAFDLPEDSIVILNGYKDHKCLKLALLGRKLGKNIVIVIENFQELPELIRLAEEMEVEPTIGFRARLYSKGHGRWQSSGGESAKFGLTMAEIIQGIQLLHSHQKENSLKLLHFHIGSQITDLRSLKDGLMESARIYAEVFKMGIPLEFFDAGGGLAIDYDGSNSTQEFSMNYNQTAYAEEIVYTLKEVCDLENIPHPKIVTESGRMLTAHHSCILTEIFDHNTTAISNYPTTGEKTDHRFVKAIRRILNELGEDYFQQAYFDAQEVKEESFQAFKLGILSLQDRAKIETLYWKICEKIVALQSKYKFSSDELLILQKQMAERYFCNLSIFQSVPDTWSIGQILPIVPISRLDQEPQIPCTLVDITCDSDGKIDRFIDENSAKETLLLHQLLPDETYCIGIFLTGAYQDIMGDLHNLFGSLNEVQIDFSKKDPNSFFIKNSNLGNSPADVLSTMRYHPKTMISEVNKILQIQLKKGRIRTHEFHDLMQSYKDNFEGYTYLDLNYRD